MPIEPDPRLDELLRAYAARRRRDAGPPLELHPVTRRLLQDEAARLRRRAARSAWRRWFPARSFRPRLGLVGVSVVFAGLLAWTAIRFTSVPEPDRELLLTQAQPPGQPADPTPRPTPASFPAAPAAGSPSSGARDGAVAERAVSGTAASKPVGATPSAAAPTIALRSTRAAPGRSRSLLREPRDGALGAEREIAAYAARPQEENEDKSKSSSSLAELGRSGALADDMTRALAMAASAAGPATNRQDAAELRIGDDPSRLASRTIDASNPAGPALAAAGSAPTPRTSQSRIRYRRIPAGGVVSAGRATGVAELIENASGLLASFEFEQSDQRVRILDSDGSVYEGSWVKGGSLPGRAPKLAPTGPAAPAGMRDGMPYAFGAGAGGSGPIPSSFRVAGTNRSLNQWLVISGNLGTSLAGGGAGVGYEETRPGQGMLRSPAPSADPVLTSSPAPVVTAAPLLLKSFGEASVRRSYGAAAGAGVSSRLQAEAQALFPSRFRATVLVGGTNAVQIEALRVIQ
ncbi:MAG: hypothetical protein JXQ71_10695 [Verrucomicrobia bacterium]|nr:hypothetical protein [Verrucomicrobiota bacterium]